MTQGMQGSWTVSVKKKSAAWEQRFSIQGSTNGVDGVYPGNTTTPSVFATGTQWGITIEHNPPGEPGWTRSRFRLANFMVSGGQFIFDIETDDTCGDLDFNDLILTCSMPLATSEYVVYGNVKTYSGLCIFNPCYPRLYYVIDDIFQLKKLVEYGPIRKIIEKFYPMRVKDIIRRPFPEPDPRPFTPLMIPSGLCDEPGIVVHGYHKELTEKHKIPGKETLKKMDNPGNGNPISYTLEAERAYFTQAISQAELAELARVKDFQLLPCTVKKMTQTLLRFIEYDRTESEKLGDPYTGEGNREILGTSITDEQGNYVFRFSQSLTQIVEEGTDVTVSENLETQIRPDIIIQIMESLPNGILYESAPYYNIQNIKRIDLCLPEYLVGKPITACQGGRPIQAIGDILMVPHAGTTLHTDGTISNSSTTGPRVKHAAWHGKLDLYACFIDTNPKVKFYTLQSKPEDDTDWHWVTESYYYPKIKTNGTTEDEKVGPYTENLRVLEPSQPKSPVGCYQNIEEDANWLNWKRFRKICLHSTLYHPAAGAVEFKIVGYDSNGEKVDGAEDIVKLFLDNVFSTGDIDYVKFGTEDPGECALLELPDVSSPLTIRYRLTDEAGFILNYALKAYRGSNTPVIIRNLSTGLPEEYEYQDDYPYRFKGTSENNLDPNDYIVIVVEPASGSWLPEDIMFCAFSFELTSQDRVTDGQVTYSTRLLTRELVGISHTPTETS